MIEKNRKYFIDGGFKEEDIEKMHNAMLDIIESVGISVPHDGILKMIRGIDGVNIEDKVVKFKPDLVEKAISDMNYPDYVKNADYIINSGAYELNVLDMDNGKIRPALTSDIVDMVKLTDSYGMYGSSPVRPSDIKSVELQEIAMSKICWENSPRNSNSVFEANERSSIRSVEYIYEMAKVADKRLCMQLWVKSPFKTDFKELDLLYRSLDKKIPMVAATMPIAGATAPIYMPGAYVQSMAEVFAGLTLLNLINKGPEAPHCLIIDSIRAYAFDFKYASFVYGSPDDILGTLFQIQLNKKYGIPVVAKSLLTASNDIDTQLGAEIMAHTMMAAMAGARIFQCSGLISIDEVFSAEKVVIDYEVVQYVKHLVSGFRFTEKDLSVDIIKEVGIGREYVSHDSTLNDYKEVSWQPEVFEHMMLRKWRQEGEPNFKDTCTEIARERIKRHEYSLPADISKELDKIYKKAVEEFGG